MGKWRDERIVRVEANQLLEDVAAMLSGRAVQCWGAGEAVPAWARVNEFAHADWEHLAGLADETEPTGRSAWDGAASFLAAELLSVASSPGGLLALQRSSLIPLELEMLASGPAPDTPAELVQLLRGPLSRARTRRTHPSAS